MRRIARALPYLGVVLLLLVVLAAVLRVGPLTRYARQALVGELSRMLDREVSIGEASVTPTGRVRLQDVVVLDRDGSPLLSAPEVTARVGGSGRWLTFLTRPTGIREVRLMSPELALRRSEAGEWNVADVLERRPEEPSRFRGDVIIEDGRVTFLDEQHGGVLTTLDDVEITVRYPDGDRLTFALAAASSEDAFDAFEARGESNSRTGITRVEGSASNLDLCYALARSGRTLPLNVEAGRADVTAELVIGEEASGGQGVSYEVRAETRDTVVGFPWLSEPVGGFRGSLRFHDGDLHLTDTMATVAEAPITADGVIANLADQPRLDLNVQTSGIRYQQIRRLLPSLSLPAQLALPSPVRVSARVRGPVSDVSVQGTMTMDVIKFKDIPWHGVSTGFEYHRGQLKLTGGAHGSPRRIEGDLDIDLRGASPKVSWSGSLEDVPLPVLAQMAGVNAGQLEGTVSLRSIDARFDTGVWLSGEFEVSGARAGSLVLGHVSGLLEVTQDSVHLRSCRLEGPTAEGSLDARIGLDGAYRVDAELDRLDLSALGAALNVAALGGACRATAHVDGVMSERSAQGQVTLGPGEVRGYPFEDLGLDFVLSEDEVTLSDLYLRAGSGEYRGHLAVAGWRRQRGARLDGQIGVSGARLRDWLPPGYAALVPVATIDGELEIGGTFGAPIIDVDLRMKSPEMAGRQFETGRVLASYQDGRTIIEEMYVEGGRSRLSVGGAYSQDAGLAVTARADPLDLADITPDLRRLWGLAASGRLAGTATVTGSLRRPEVAFSATAVPFSVNDLSFTELSLSGSWRDGVVMFERCVVTGDDCEVSLVGEFDGPAAALDATLHLDNFDIGTALMAADRAVWRLHRAGEPAERFARYARLPRPITGRLDGTVRIVGPLREPRVAVVQSEETPAEPGLRLRKLAYEGREIEVIECMELDVGLRRDQRGSWSLRSASVDVLAFHQMAIVKVVGSISADGEADLKGDVANLDLSLVSPWLPQPVELGGVATAYFDVTGSIRQAIVRGDISIDRLRIHGVEVESAQVGPLRLERDLLTLEEIRLRDGEMLARGSVTLPLPDGSAAVSDILRIPRGELRIEDAHAALLPGMPSIDLDAHIYLMGNRLIFRDSGGPDIPDPQPGIVGRMGSGTLNLSGEVVLRHLSPSEWGRNRFDIACDMKGVDLVVPGAMKAKLDGKLLLTSAPDTAMPLLATPEGEPLEVSQAEIGVPKIEKPGSPVDLPFTPLVQVRIRVGDDVRFRYGAERRPTEVKIDAGEPGQGRGAPGYVDLSGELSVHGLQADAELHSGEGQLAFPNGTLTLRRGTMWIRRVPGELPRVTISGEADGRIGEYSVSLRPVGQIYPFAEVTEGGIMVPLLSLNAVTIPHLDEAYVMALLVGPVVAPTSGRTNDLASLLAVPGTGGDSGAEITGVTLPQFGNPLGIQEMALDVGTSGVVRLRLGEELFRRLRVVYVSALTGPTASESFRVMLEVTPLVSVGWSIDEVEQERWEVQSLLAF